MGRLVRKLKVIEYKKNSFYYLSNYNVVTFKIEVTWHTINLALCKTYILERNQM